MSYPRFVYLLGAGGIGMSALGMFFLNRGVRVAGYDLCSGVTTDMLRQKGAEIVFDDDSDIIPPEIKSSKCDTWVIYTPAVPSNLRLLTWFTENSFRILKRAEVLGMITESMKTFAVAGTHGKTTTTAAISHILQNNGVDCTAFIGGISKNFKSNFIDGKSEVAVVEADEYDRSFHFLKPDYAVVTSVEPDHLDIYGSYDNVKESFRVFAEGIKTGGRLSVHYNYSDIFKGAEIKHQTYGKNKEAEYRAENISCESSGIVFDFVFPDTKVCSVTVPVFGLHNAENLVAAGSVAHMFGIKPADICSALATFKGVGRRFDVILNSEKMLVDDYAHHPDEINALAETLNQHFPGKSYAAVFQPHLFTRTRDFADRFAESLSRFHSVILMDIYPAREKQIDGVTSSMLKDKITSPFRECVNGRSVISLLEQTSFDILVTIGAGNVDSLLPELKKWICRKYECKG